MQLLATGFLSADPVDVRFCCVVFSGIACDGLRKETCPN